MLTLNTGDITYNDIAYIINKCNIAHRFYLLSLSTVYFTNEVTLANFTSDITYNDIAYINNKYNITYGFFYLLSFSIVY